MYILHFRNDEGYTTGTYTDFEVCLSLYVCEFFCESLNTFLHVNSLYCKLSEKHFKKPGMLKTYSVVGLVNLYLLYWSR